MLVKWATMCPIDYHPNLSIHPSTEIERRLQASESKVEQLTEDKRKLVSKTSRWFVRTVQVIHYSQLFKRQYISLCIAGHRDVATGFKGYLLFNCCAMFMANM